MDIYTFNRWLHEILTCTVDATGRANLWTPLAVIRCTTSTNRSAIAGNLATSLVGTERLTFIQTLRRALHIWLRAAIPVTQGTFTCWYCMAMCHLAVGIRMRNTVSTWTRLARMIVAIWPWALDSTDLAQRTYNIVKLNKHLNSLMATVNATNPISSSAVDGLTAVSQQMTIMSTEKDQCRNQWHNYWHPIALCC